MARLVLDNITKAYPRQTVLRGLNLDVADGEFVALVGPSGCGKSTLLRLVAGLDDVSSGDILLGGRRINDMSPKDRNVAMVFQNYALYPHMNVAQNLGFALRLQGQPAEQVRQRVREVAQILGLQALLQRLPAQLSGGQRQRVAMGRAIVRKPSLFLFDEPLSNLDAKLRVQMRTEIKALHQRLRTTTLYLTHDQIEAMTMADRIVVLRDGQIEQVGTPLALYDRPRNAFVAQFIGSPAMNLIAARADGEGAAARLFTDDGLPLPLPPGVQLASGQQVLLGVRSEHIRLAPQDDAVVTARVLVAEPTGGDTRLVTELGAQRLTLTTAFRTVPAPGELVYLRLDTQAMHVFDARDGQQLN